ncbi:MAG TPA: DUF1684 domain-containing protein, partial [Kofleriaceae bacterium]|nr:DUF1684 domain-containing protein [Kofleriaceae bacterium]
LAVQDGAAPVEPLERDGRRYEVVGRPGHMSVRVRDPRARALREFPGIPYFEIDPRWRLSCRFEPLDPPAVEMVPRTDGVDLPTPRVGTARFELDGGPHALAVYHEDSSGRWYIPFSDATSGQETYGAGRSLYVEPPAPGEPLVIDFNLAFNLPCAFNWLVACPVPPAHNRLAIAVRAGERTPPWSAPLEEP